MDTNVERPSCVTVAGGLRRASTMLASPPRMNDARAVDRVRPRICALRAIGTAVAARQRVCAGTAYTLCVFTAIGRSVHSES
jgi:hypothetical protein